MSWRKPPKVSGLEMEELNSGTVGHERALQGTISANHFGVSRSYIVIVIALSIVIVGLKLPTAIVVVMSNAQYSVSPC